ncbi:hypothetical protein R1sor_019399 [Riccia sorocarpa]|uniref:Ferric oxidoreductase domain-containing protein n=1 Tax=Riccia sorocarpa TaxID=122646 RepID=A0ABD3IF48_9MARC
MESYVYIKGASQMRVALRVLISVAIIWWYLFRFLQPINKAVLWIRKADKQNSQDFLGTRVSRASPFLRLIGVSFESAVKYHTWLGLTCIWILIFHGILMLTYFLYIHHPRELLIWADSAICSLSRNNWSWSRIADAVYCLGDNAQKPFQYLLLHTPPVSRVPPILPFSTLFHRWSTSSPQSCSSSWIASFV